MRFVLFLYGSIYICVSSIYMYAVRFIFVQFDLYERVLKILSVTERHNHLSCPWPLLFAELALKLVLKGNELERKQGTQIGFSSCYAEAGFSFNIDLKIKEAFDKLSSFELKLIFISRLQNFFNLNSFFHSGLKTVWLKILEFIGSNYGWWQTCKLQRGNSILFRKCRPWEHLFKYSSGKLPFKWIYFNKLSWKKSLKKEKEKDAFGFLVTLL